MSLTPQDRMRWWERVTLALLVALLVTLAWWLLGCLAPGPWNLDPPSGEGEHAPMRPAVEARCAHDGGIWDEEAGCCVPEGESVCVERVER